MQVRISISFTMQKIHWSFENKIYIQTYFPLLSSYTEKQNILAASSKLKFLGSSYMRLSQFLSSFLHPREWNCIHLSSELFQICFPKSLRTVLAYNSKLSESHSPTVPITYTSSDTLPDSKRGLGLCPSQASALRLLPPGFADLLRSYLLNLMTQLGFNTSILNKQTARRTLYQNISKCQLVPILHMAVLLFSGAYCLALL